MIFTARGQKWSLAWCLLTACVVGLRCNIPAQAAEEKPAPPDWQVEQTIQLAGARVSLSRPVLVMRDRGYLWFPTLIPLADDSLLAIATNYADTSVKQSTGLASWSADGGKTWSKPITGDYGDEQVRLPNGDELLLPYHLYPDGAEVTARGVLVPRGKRELQLSEPAVRVSGFPRMPKLQSAELNLAGFWFNGQAVPLSQGGYLATLHGYYAGDKRLNLLVADSADGRKWKIRSTVADAQSSLPGSDGPCESAMARLKDGRLVCVFRLASKVPLGCSFTADEGKTWSEPVAMQGPLSVQPSLAVLADDTLALSSGRPGIFCWFDFSGKAENWQAVDLVAHHNRCLPGETIKIPENVSQHQTSSYTQVIALDERNLLLIYDRIQRGWNAIPEGVDETNSVWVVRLTVERE